MKTLSLALILALVGPNPSYAQDASLDRDEVAVIKKKLVTVQTALGDDRTVCPGFRRFNLPTDFNPAEDGKFRPIRSSLSLRYSDKASKNSQAVSRRLPRIFRPDIPRRLPAGTSGGHDEDDGRNANDGDTGCRGIDGATKTADVGLRSIQYGRRHRDRP